MIVNYPVLVTKNTSSTIKCVIKEAYDKDGNRITSLNGYVVKLRVKNEIGDNDILFEKNGVLSGTNEILFNLNGSEFNAVRDYETVYANIVIEGNDGTKAVVYGKNGSIFPIIVVPYI